MEHKVIRAVMVLLYIGIVLNVFFAGATIYPGLGLFNFGSSSIFSIPKSSSYWQILDSILTFFWLVVGLYALYKFAFNTTGA